MDPILSQQFGINSDEGLALRGAGSDFGLPRDRGSVVGAAQPDGNVGNDAVSKDLAADVIREIAEADNDGH